MQTSNRKGNTMIEMLAVITVMCGLAATSIVVLSTLDRLGQTGITQAASVRETQRFADTLRRLAKSASQASVDANSHALVLTDEHYEHRFAESADGSFVDYVGTPVVDQSTSDASNATVRRHDRFLIGPHAGFAFDRRDQERLIAVHWTRELGASVELRIEALLADGETP